MLLQGELSSFPIIFESIANVDNLLEVFSLTLILGTTQNQNPWKQFNVFVKSSQSIT